jgi:plastocyanin
MPLRTPALALVAGSAALFVAACGGGEERAAKTHAAHVEVRTFIFRPSSLVVSPGTTVTWRNSDQAEHTVTSGPRADPDSPGRPDGRFSGRLTESGGTFSHTFTSAGTYRYFCALHTGSGMTARVTVR